MRRLQPILLGVVSGVIGASVALGGTSLVSAASSVERIHACVGTAGATRIVEGPAACLPLERAVSWPAETGGLSIETADKVLSTTMQGGMVEGEVWCPSPDATAIGGGHDGGDLMPVDHFYENHPVVAEDGSQGWRVRYWPETFGNSGDDNIVRIYVTCAH